jgi:cell shape-determining protein MreC
MSLAISEANPNQLLEKKKVEQQRNLRQLASFMSQTKALNPNFWEHFHNKFPWINNANS